MSEFSKRSEDSNRRLAEALGRVYGALVARGGAGTGQNRGGADEEEAINDMPSVDPGALNSAVNELEGLIDNFRTLYEERLHQLETERSQLKTDAEAREQSTNKLLKDLEGENERLSDTNHSLQRELNELQSKIKTTETSLKEKEKEVGGLIDQLRAHQEDRRQASVGRKEREREKEEKTEELKWRLKEEEKERAEREKELVATLDTERSLRSALDECRHQLEATHLDLRNTQQELHSTEATLATTGEELTNLKHQFQPKEEELQALQEKIADRAQYLNELLDRRSGDYSRQVQEEILAQTRAYDLLLKTITNHLTNSSHPSSSSSSSSSDTLLSPTQTLHLATSLRDFLNPHLLPPPPPPSSPTPSSSSPSSLLSSSSPLSSPRLPRDDTITVSYHRYMNTFVDFTQRVRVGEFRVCPKSRLRLHRLQQWRHLFKEISLRPGPGLVLNECSMCDLISLMKTVAKKLSLSSTSLLLYNIDKTRIGGTAVRLWVLRQALSPTHQYEVDSLLSDLSLCGHRLTFVTLADPLGTPSPLEQWEAVHKRVVGRLEESPMVDVIGGGEGEEGRGKGRRANSMDMIDLENTKSTTQLLDQQQSSRDRDEIQLHMNGGQGRRRQMGVARRAGFHLRALLRIMCTGCVSSSGSHGNTQYQHLEEIPTS